jgi:transmembrane 9 superfamily protein 2/4
MIIIFCFLGIVNGYVSNFVYKNNGGKNWIKNTLISCILFPGISIIILFFVRMLFTFENSTIGLKLSEILLLIILWICISSPLTLLGSFLAINKKKIKFPCKINVLPTFIPKKPWFLKIKYVSFIAGLIPFGTIFIEFLYLLAYVWKYQVTYLASFLIFSIFFSVIITSEISIIFVYLNLCKGDYNWWWKSFFISASPGLYILGYSFYYLFHLNITRFSAILVYFVIMGEITMVACLICGSCGVLLTWAFLIMIYSKIKID